MNEQQRAVVQMALEAFEFDDLPLNQQNVDAWDAVRNNAVTALRQLLEQPVQEPVAWTAPEQCDSPAICRIGRACAGQFETQKECTTPPAAQPAEIQ